MKPFVLPACNPLYPEVIIRNVYELREILKYQNQMYLAEYKKNLPWYIRVTNCGHGLKIKEFELEIIIE